MREKVYESLMGVQSIMESQHPPSRQLAPTELKVI